MTVSRVINNRARVAATTRHQVEKAIKDLGYVPNGLARGLQRGRTHTIALIVSDISNPFFTLVARGVEDMAQSHGYALILGNSDESVQKEQQYVNVMLSNRIDGLLLTPAGNGSSKTLRFLTRHLTKFVLIDRDIEGVSADAVVGDSIGGARMLTQHLLNLGHRRIALVTGQREVPTARDRLRGYEEALQAESIAPHYSLIMEQNYTREGGYRATQQLLTLPPEERPTAIFACNNFLGIGVIEALRDAQLEVPRDMAVVCFDDIEFASALHPFLTVLAQPARTFGSIATQLLLERLDGAETSLPHKVVLPPTLIIRASCGAQLAKLGMRDA